MSNQPLWKQLEEATGTVTDWPKVIELLQDNLADYLIEKEKHVKFLISEANKAKMGEMPEITLCRDCIYWECNTDRSELENYPRNIKPSDGWIDGECSKLKYETYISTYGGNAVESIETDANFWCACGEPK